MASIVRKGNCVSIVYYDPKVINPKTGKPKQIWKKTTEENALEDKLKIELELLQGTNAKTPYSSFWNSGSPSTARKTGR